MLHPKVRCQTQIHIFYRNDHKIIGLLRSSSSNGQGVGVAWSLLHAHLGVQGPPRILLRQQTVLPLHNDCSLPMLLSREEYSSWLLYDVAVLKTNCTWMCWYKHSFSYFELFFKNLRILFYSKWLLLYEVSITSNKENGLGTWESWAYYWLSCCMNTLVLNKQEASLSKGFLTISLPFLYL